MLTDAQCRKAKAVDKPAKLADAGGLYLYVTPSGLRSWRMKYRFAGKEKKLNFGPYPDVSLAEARDRRDAARRSIRDHIDPSVEKRSKASSAAAAAGKTLETVAEAWFEINKVRWSDRHSEDVIQSLRRDIFPSVGSLPIRDVHGPKLIEVLRAIEDRPAIETAKRIRQRLSSVFAYAMAEGLVQSDPSASLGKALRPIAKRGKQPAITDLDLARKVLVDAEATEAHPLTKLGLRLLALTAVRPGELRGAMWTEFEGLGGAEPLWRVPAARMKGKLARKEEEGGDHLVPLSRQAVDVLVTTRRISGRGPLAFPSSRHSHRPMSENAIGYLLNRAGYHHRHVPHGWRATFSTIMNGLYPADSAVIELMLAHIPANRVKAAYDRAQHGGRRRELAQIWADLIAADLPAADDMVLGPRR